jgi:hypothetical protein
MLKKGIAAIAVSKKPKILTCLAINMELNAPTAKQNVVISIAWRHFETQHRFTAKMQP